MLLSHCPNCQHDNQPGERFCAACGVPLDLKPCPVCGKVDNIKATVCAGCGAHFPALTGVHAGESGAHAATPAKPMPPVVSPPPTTMRALPLIIVALAAGGIPLLWLYRNTMPVPKAWQTQTSGVEAAPAPLPLPAARPESATQAPQVVPPTASAPALIPLPPKAAAQPAVETAPAVEATAKPPAAAKPVAPVKPAGKPVAKAPAAPRPSVPGASECTEALAAVGLCDPKAAR
ncbi:MAG: zinc ribbon domain-containing protein [Rhodocyclales bacterium]|nr:zinc ribbon domain-containing protein [Rhodocyclales bacterium]